MPNPSTGARVRVPVHDVAAHLLATEATTEEILDVAWVAVLRRDQPVLELCIDALDIKLGRAALLRLAVTP
jgi:hypothetical protein